MQRTDIDQLSMGTVLTENEQKSISIKIFEQRIKLLQQHFLKTGLPGYILCVTVVFIGLYNVINPSLIISWYVTSLLIQLFRLIAVIQFEKSSYHYYIHLGFVCASAAIWSFAGTVLMSHSDPVHQMIIVLVIAGVTAGATQSLQPSLIGSLLYVILAVVPVGVWVLYAGGSYYVVGFALLGYVAFTAGVSLSNYNLIIRELRLYYENIYLVKHLQESESRFRKSFASAPIGMALVSTEGRYIKVNHALCQLLGYSEAELLQMDLQTLAYHDDLPILLAEMKKLNTDKTATSQMEIRFINKNGHVFWIMLNISLITDSNNKPFYLIAQVQDVDERKKAEELLQNIAYYDSLTGLANRKQLELWFDKALSYAKRHHKNIVIYFLDLDHFKSINDKFGHEMGDILLKIVSDRLLHCIRQSDIVARFGGDEILLITMETSTTEEIIAITQKIKIAISAPIEVKEQMFNLTFSIGISIYPKDGESLSLLIKNADQALYNAKAEGGNTYKFYSPNH